MRLIDADALDLDREVELADHWKTAHEIANCVKYAPTVDAVPIIRCKDCINWDTDWTTHPPDHYCPAIDQFTSADFYCGYSEKKDLEEQKCTFTDTEL